MARILGIEPISIPDDGPIYSSTKDEPVVQPVQIEFTPMPEVEILRRPALIPYIPVNEQPYVEPVATPEPEVVPVWNHPTLIPYAEQEEQPVDALPVLQPYTPEEPQPVADVPLYQSTQTDTPEPIAERVFNPEPETLFVPRTPIVTTPEPVVAPEVVSTPEPVVEPEIFTRHLILIPNEPEQQVTDTPSPYIIEPPGDTSEDLSRHPQITLNEDIVPVDALPVLQPYNPDTLPSVSGQPDYNSSQVIIDVPALNERYSEPVAEKIVEDVKNNIPLEPAIAEDLVDNKIAVSKYNIAGETNFVDKVVNYVYKLIYKK